MISSSNRYESLFLYETVVGFLVFYALISPFPTDWVTILLTIIISYVVAIFLLKEAQRQIIHPLTSIIILCIFRIDQIILKTVFTEILTELTTQVLFLMLKYSDSILLLTLLISFCVFQSLSLNRMKSYSKRFSLVTLFVVFFILFLFTFSPEEVLLVNKTTIQIENFTRISIIDSCSGIYGLIIFLSSFIFFVNVTRSNREFKREHVIAFGTVGMIGVYLLNLFRILILIILSLYFPTNVWSEAHIYLGGIFIIGYLAIFWGIIWSRIPVRSSS
ncbi:MAG: hypothetical protein JSW11_08745 [Candidatus Heimdallarchaeota archaeon]|nr:MAG: hypothetical protein JSW11_08745 [Candidatus Heimdallarchaeota archaeon]